VGVNASDTFGAVVQCGDWAGQAKADDGDFRSTLRDALTAKGLTNPGEFVVGFRTYHGENHVQRPLSPVRVTALVVPATNFEEAQRYLRDTNPLQVRDVHAEFDLAEFGALFKRFSIAVA
jgi:hypothetical protein